MKHSAEVEMAVLGALIEQPGRCLSHADERMVTVDSFFVPYNRELFDAILLEREKNRHGIVDEVSLVARMPEEIAPKGGWRAYVDACLDSCVTTAHFEHHVQLLKEDESVREVEQLQQNLKNMIRSGEFKAQDMLDEVNACVQHVTEGMSVSRESETVGDVAKRASREWRDIAGGKMVGVPSRWKELNQYIGSYIYGDCNIFAAYRDIGKTFVMCNEVVHAAVTLGIPSYIVSLDMRKEQIVQRLLAQIAGFSTFKMDVGSATAEEMAALGEAEEVLAKAPIQIYAGPGEVGRIVNTLTSHVQKDGTKFVWIDYFQRMWARGKHQNRNSELEYVCRKMIDFFLEYKVSGNVLSQFNRSAEQQDRPPRLSDLKDCGSLEQDARKIVLISQAEDPTGHGNYFKWDIAKNNTGPKGQVHFRRIANRGMWIPAK